MCTSWKKKTFIVCKFHHSLFGHNLLPFPSPAQSFQEFAGLLQEVEHDRMMLVGYQLPLR